MVLPSRKLGSAETTREKYYAKERYITDEVIAKKFDDKPETPQ